MIKIWIIILILNKFGKYLIGSLMVWWRNEENPIYGWLDSAKFHFLLRRPTRNFLQAICLYVPSILWCHHLGSQGLYSMGGENWMVTEELLRPGMKVAEMTSAHIPFTKTGQWFQLKYTWGWAMETGQHWYSVSTSQSPPPPILLWPLFSDKQGNMSSLLHDTWLNHMRRIDFPVLTLKQTLQMSHARWY